jgi:hypothetical protein
VCHKRNAREFFGRNARDVCLIWKECYGCVSGIEEMLGCESETEGTLWMYVWYGKKAGGVCLERKETLGMVH